MGYEVQGLGTGWDKPLTQMYWQHRSPTLYIRPFHDIFLLYLSFFNYLRSLYDSSGSLTTGSVFVLLFHVFIYVNVQAMCVHVPFGNGQVQCSS